jgi:hypothetical protein
MIMSFIKDLCEGKKDEYIHKQFVRFGKGNYERFLIKLKKGKKLSVKTSFDISNDLFKLIVDNCKEDLEVSGKIISNYSLEGEIEAEEFTKRGKLFTAVIKGTFSPKVLQGWFEKFQLSYILLSLKGKDFKLKCKAALPKPGGKLKDNFCSASIPLEFVKEFDFDFGEDFKNAIIVHKLEINDIVIPDEFKEDFVNARDKAIRKGKFIRAIELDEKQIVKEYPLEV